MRMTKRTVLLAISLAALSVTAADADFKAGFARVDVTPPLGIPMPGYFQKRLATHVVEPLAAECLAVSYADTTGFVFSVDNLHLSETVITRANAGILARTGVPAARQFIHSTHTHTGGDTRVRKSHTPEEARLVEFYAELVASRLIEAAVTAASDLAPSTLAIGKTECRGISFIRRFRMKDGSVKTNPGFTDPNVVGPLGEPDESLQLIRFRRTGAPDLALVNFGTHPDTVGGTGISADWPAYVRSTFENGVGGGVKCLCLNGAQGDVNHHDRHATPGRAKMPRRLIHLYMGRTIAGAAMHVWDACEIVPAGPISGAVAQMTAPANVPTADERKWIALFDAGKKSEIPLGPMEIMTLTSPTSRARTLMNGPDHFELPVSSLAIGTSVAFAGFPGEPFVKIGRDVKAASPFRMTCVACLVNGDNGYFPSTEAFSQGGYEALSSKFARPTGDLLTAFQVEQLKRLHD